MSFARKQGHFRRVWRWPLLIAVASLIGLISALLGDGVWNTLSWITLGAPVAVVAIASYRAHPAR